MILKACSECSPSHLNMTPPFIPLSSIKFTFFHPSFFTFLSLHTDRIISCPLLSFLSCPVLSSPLLCFQPPSLPSSLLSKDCPSSSLLSSPLFFLLLALFSTLSPFYSLPFNTSSSDTADRWPVGLPRISRLAFTLCATPPVFVCCGVFQELPPPLGTYTADVLTGFSQVTERLKPYLTFVLF